MCFDRLPDVWVVSPTHNPGQWNIALLTDGRDLIVSCNNVVDRQLQSSVAISLQHVGASVENHKVGLLITNDWQHSFLQQP